VSFTDAIRTCLRKYATFDGRATRSEFWFFYLFTLVVGFIGYIPLIVFGIIGSADNAIGTLFRLLAILWWIVWIVLIIALYIPFLAVGCRRLHDRGQSGWLQLLLLVPCGGIVLIVFWAMEGTPTDNAYGPKPA
jgi:uncharacterized membrane protein YhaH (DUF805 family)